MTVKITIMNTPLLLCVCPNISLQHPKKLYMATFAAFLTHK